MMCPGELTRRQASMYLPDVAEIEELRLRYNPLQARLIPAHVTLCREDEVDDWLVVQTRIKRLLPIQMTIGFGRAVRHGDLVYLPAVSGIEQFDQLRIQLLAPGFKKVRSQSPHVTIIHPRNGRCTDDIYGEIVERLQPFSWTFREISLIEQTNGGPWAPIAQFGSSKSST